MRWISPSSSGEAFSRRAAMGRARLNRLCVVGSPNLRVELERLVAGRVELRLVDGEVLRSASQSQADHRRRREGDSGS